MEQSNRVYEEKHGDEHISLRQSISNQNSKQINVKKIVELIQQSESTYDKAHDREVIFIIGLTGSGKSTTANFLLGANMIEKTYTEEVLIEDVAYCVQKSVVDSNDGQFQIGHQKQSETSSFKFAEIKNSDLVLCDAPGFFDSRGVEVEIANSVCLSNFLKQCKSVRPILIINYDDMKGQVGQSLKGLLKLIINLINQPNEESLDNFLVFFTHVPDNINTIKFEIISTLKVLNQDNNQLGSQFLKVILKQINAGQSKIINPLKDSRSEFLNIIENKNSIQNPSNFFDFSYSDYINCQMNIYSEQIFNEISQILEQREFQEIVPLLQEKKLSKYVNQNFLQIQLKKCIEKVYQFTKTKADSVISILREQAEQNNKLYNRYCYQLVRVKQYLQIIEKNLADLFKGCEVSLNDFIQDIIQISEQIEKKGVDFFHINIQITENCLSKLQEISLSINQTNVIFERLKKSILNIYNSEFQLLQQKSNEFFQKQKSSLFKNNLQKQIEEFVVKFQILNQTEKIFSPYFKQFQEMSYYKQTIILFEQKNKLNVDTIQKIVNDLKQLLNKTEVESSQSSITFWLNAIKPNCEMLILKLLSENLQYNRHVEKSQEYYELAFEKVNGLTDDILRYLSENIQKKKQLVSVTEQLIALDYLRKIDEDIFNKTVKYEQFQIEIKLRIENQIKKAKVILKEITDQKQYEQNEDFRIKMTSQNPKFKKLQKLQSFLKKCYLFDSYFNLKSVEQALENQKKSLCSFFNLCINKFNEYAQEKEFKTLLEVYQSLENISQMDELICNQDLLMSKQQSFSIVEKKIKNQINFIKKEVENLNTQNSNALNQYTWINLNDYLIQLKYIKEIPITNSEINKFAQLISSEIRDFLDTYINENTISFDEDNNLEKIKVLLQNKQISIWANFLSNIKYITNQSEFIKILSDLDKIYNKLEVKVILLFEKIISQHEELILNKDDYKLIINSYENIKEFQQQFRKVIPSLSDTFKQIKNPHEKIKKISENKIFIQIKKNQFIKIDSQLQFLINLESILEQNKIFNVFEQLFKILKEKNIDTVYKITQQYIQSIDIIFIQTICEELSNIQKTYHLFTKFQNQLDISNFLNQSRILIQDTLQKIQQLFVFKINIKYNISLQKLDDLETNYFQLNSLYIETIKIFNQEQNQIPHPQQIMTIIEEEIKKFSYNINDNSKRIKWLFNLDEAIKRGKPEFESIYIEERENNKKNLKEVFLNFFIGIRESINKKNIKKYQQIFGEAQTLLGELTKNDAFKSEFKDILDELDGLQKQIKNIEEIQNKILNDYQKLDQKYPVIHPNEFKILFENIFNNQNDKYFQDNFINDLKKKQDEFLEKIQINQQLSEIEKVIKNENQKLSNEAVTNLINHQQFFIVIENIFKVDEIQKQMQRINQILNQTNIQLKEISHLKKKIFKEDYLDEKSIKNFKSKLEKFNAFIIKIQSEEFNTQIQQNQQLKEICNDIDSLEEIEIQLLKQLQEKQKLIDENLEAQNYYVVKQNLITLQQKQFLFQIFIQKQQINIEQIWKKIDKEIDQLTKEVSNIIEKTFSYNKQLSEKINRIYKTEEEFKDLNFLSFKSISYIEIIQKQILEKILKETSIFRSYQALNYQLLANKLVELHKVGECIIQFNELVQQQIKESLQYFKKITSNNDVFLIGYELQRYPIGQQLIGTLKEFDSIKIDQFIQIGKHDLEYIIEQFSYSIEGKEEEKLSQNQKILLMEHYKNYNSAYEGILNQYKFENVFQKLIDNIKYFIKNQKWSINNWNQKTKKAMVELLAKICAFWTLKESSNLTKNRQGQQIYKKPNHTQILAIMVLLDFDSNNDTWFGFRKTPFQNQIIEILTGEGKSLTFGFSSILLSLIGYNVDVVCYSTYLSERDWETFKPYFIIFGIEHKIYYGTFKQMSERYLNRHINVRQLSLNAIEGTFQNKLQNADDKNQKILLIDEVDVFFNFEYFGKNYNPVTHLKDSDIEKMIKNIWKMRNDKSEEQIITLTKESDIFQNLLKKYPNIYLERQLQELAKYVKQIKDHYDQSQYIVKDDKIWYQNLDGTLTTDTFSYQTLFAYFLQNDQKNGISNDALDQKISLILGCGNVSYAEIPNIYSAILGVSGTLKTLNPVMKKYLQKRYQINKVAYAPSMFKASNNEQIIKVEQDQDNQYLQIKEISYKARMNNQSVIIFFKNQKEIDSYLQSGQSVVDKTDHNKLICGLSLNEVSIVVSKSTRSKEITLSVREFGRGTDFICYDDTVKNNGGVVIIQTFLSKQQTEEVQIKGRTARQGQVGQFYLILNQKQLAKQLKITKDQVDQIMELENSKQIFNSISEKRNQIEQQKFNDIDQSLTNALDYHNKTMEFYKNLKAGNKKEIYKFFNDNS